jgi:hypothetical protein
MTKLIIITDLIFQFSHFYNRNDFIFLQTKRKHPIFFSERELLISESIAAYLKDSAVNWSSVFASEFFKSTMNSEEHLPSFLPSRLAISYIIL